MKIVRSCLLRLLEIGLDLEERWLIFIVRAQIFEVLYYLPVAPGERWFEPQLLDMSVSCIASCSHLFKVGRKYGFTS